MNLKMFLGPVLALAVVALTLIGWAPATSLEDEKTLPASEIAKVLTDMKIEAESDKDGEDKTFWTWEVNGAKVSLYQYGGEGDTASSLAITTQLKEEAGLELANAWNAATRYSKAYAIEEGTVLEDDLDISVAPSKAVIQEFIKDYLTQLEVFREVLKEAE